MGGSVSSLRYLGGYEGSIDGFLGELGEHADLKNTKYLGSSRLLKTVKGWQGDVPVTVKTFFKPANSPDFAATVAAIEAERVTIEASPNALPYQRIVESPRAIYAIRQFVQDNLYDRLSIRPFLEGVEKRWIVFQLLNCLKELHARNVYHGDIKAENVLVTSWNWVYLTDFASFKPVYLPEDDPGDFSFFFDTSSRRICYLAPERFLKRGQSRDSGGLTAAMDIFSLGCVIAELFLEGAPLFTLPQLFRYRSGDESLVNNALLKIDDTHIRSLVRDMISLDPQDRRSAGEYLTRWRYKAFPVYFSTVLYQYCANLADPQLLPADSELNMSDERMIRLSGDLDKLLGFGNGGKGTSSRRSPTKQQSVSDPAKWTIDEDGALIILSIVLSSMRSCSAPSSRLSALEMSLLLCEHLSDDIKLDRCVPYAMSLIKDPSPLVRASVVRILRDVITSVKSISPVNAFVFQEYILPELKSLVADREALVRCVLAACIGDLALEAGRFLDMFQSLKKSGAFAQGTLELEGLGLNANDEESYQSEYYDLNLVVLDTTIVLLTDHDSTVRRALLSNLQPLCIFLGSAAAKDILLSHLMTYLSDQDWLLRRDLFGALVTVAIFANDHSYDAFVVPLITQSLADSEEYVAARMIEALVPMADLAILESSTLWTVMSQVSRFLFHPNLLIRRAAVVLAVAVSNFCSDVDRFCILIPLLTPYLARPIIEVTERTLFDNLKPPLSRVMFEITINWASKSDRSEYWKSVSDIGSTLDPLKLRKETANHASMSLASIKAKFQTCAARCYEDAQFIAKLTNVRMTDNDAELKIELMKPFLLKLGADISARKAMEDKSTSQTLNRVIPIKSMDVMPQITFIDRLPDSESTTEIESGLEEVVLSRSDPMHSPRPESDSSSKQGSSGTSLANEESTRRAEGLLDTGSAHTGSDKQSNENKGARSRTVSRDLAQRHLLSTNAKSLAAAETNDTIAFGVVDHNSLGTQSQDRSSLPSSGQARYRAVYSYEGKNVNILNLLDRVYEEHFHESSFDLGPQILKSDIQSYQPLRNNKGQTGNKPWKPNGILVANFVEHKGPINNISVNFDHSAFASSSDDGTVKIWNTDQLQRKVAYRSKLTYRHEGSPAISTVTYIKNYNAICSAAKDGSLNLVRLLISREMAETKYVGSKLVGSYKLEDGEYGVRIEQISLGSTNCLVVATSQSRIIGLSMNNLSAIFVLRVPYSHGILSDIVIDKKGHWLVSGTMRGVLDLWDLRFFIKLKSWGIPGLNPVRSLCIHPSRGRGKWVCVAASNDEGSEVTVWDIDKLTCREVYTAGLLKRFKPQAYEPVKVDELERSERWMDAGSGKVESEELETGASLARLKMRSAFQAIVPVVDVLKKDQDVRALRGFLITAGSDFCVRFWDISGVERSLVVSGQSIDEPSSQFVTTYSSPAVQVACHAYVSDISAAISAKMARKNPGNGGEPSSASAASPLSTSSQRTSIKPSRISLIMQQQQRIFDAHLDIVQALAFIEHPYAMIISGDRSGVLKVFS